MTVLSRLIRFFSTGILEVRLKELDSVRAFFLKYLRVIVLAFLGFARDNCTLRASSLTYYSLLFIPFRRSPPRESKKQLTPFERMFLTHTCCLVTLKLPKAVKALLHVARRTSLQNGLW